MAEVFRIEAPYREPFVLERLTFGDGDEPVVACVAGMHGTELTGVHALNIVARTLGMLRVSGRVHLLPIVNSFGVDQGTKRWPFDDRDINRAFPGDPAGSPVQRIAYALLDATRADVCVDLHSGSRVVRELPQVRVPLSGPELAYARAMELPVVWRRAGDRLEATGLVGAWREAARAALHLVGGRGGDLDLDHARALANGILRLLGHLGVLGGGLVDPGETIVDTTRQGVCYHYSMCGGFWVPEVSVGDTVHPGHLLGAVVEVIGGRRLEEVRATGEGVIVTMRRYPVVHARELLVRVAEKL
ncbi:MAG TPA: succinylglutamate desuccinylase/aspartoacylase family protein [Myxococcota bacterium]|nr:succinylglutamate desuccinylase/aspartoacylase family protein [Myxococcota bacterium]